MPPSHSRLIPHFSTTHPYCVENERLTLALPGHPEQTLVERLREVQEEQLMAREEQEVAECCRSSSAHCNADLQASIVQQQGLVDESNTLATSQHQCIKTLQEEVHCFRDHTSFLERLVWEFPEEGFYEVSLPPVSDLEWELARGLDSMDPNLIAWNFQLVLEYLQATRGIHGELHFSDNFPFLTIAPPFKSALEPPLHHRMFTLDTALPCHGAGKWEDTVPAFPSLDHFTRDWEELMVLYVHHLSDTLLLEPPAQADIAVGDDMVTPLSASQTVPLFLLEQFSPTSPSPSHTSPVSLPLFGSVAPLAIDLTGDDNNDLYKSQEEAIRRLSWGSVEARASGLNVKEESL
ncbi:hypothetical protein F5876DRAFT_70323 [Lentinula aff. lateritia]|uniref:Uncharacterized protein n=1 Tax=Lentinula aff. lateritia TaxID=2804960 RepID=A0ACC1TJA3_9AGAR|nr:hypothetical protein F5876DRAFT_70323 [Lentinula aff. lateritia]